MFVAASARLRSLRKQIAPDFLDLFLAANPNSPRSSINEGECVRCYNRMSFFLQ
jgi:hypothetical protein